MTEARQITLRPAATGMAGRCWLAASSALLLSACMQAKAPESQAEAPVAVVPARPAAAQPPAPAPDGARPTAPERNGHAGLPQANGHPRPPPPPAPEPELPEEIATSGRHRPQLSGRLGTGMPVNGSRPPDPPAAPAAPEPAAAPAAGSEVEDYSVSVTATRELKLPGPPGKLAVWIGLTRNIPATPSGETGAARGLHERGRTARITPVALGMDTDPPTGCLKIDPDGSEKIFSLKPRSRGRFKVGASVELFESDDCSGTPVPKSSELISVEVKVGYASRLDELGDQAWQTLADFWDKALALASALLLFLLRKKLSRWFGLREQK